MSTDKPVISVYVQQDVYSRLIEEHLDRKGILSRKNSMSEVVNQCLQEYFYFKDSYPSLIIPARVLVD